MALEIVEQTNTGDVHEQRIERCACCGDAPTAERQRLCQRCLEYECFPSEGCRRPLGDWDDQALRPEGTAP